MQVALQLSVTRIRECGANEDANTSQMLKALTENDWGESRCSATGRVSDAHDLSWLYALQGDKAVRNVGEQVLNPVGECANDQNGNSA